MKYRFSNLLKLLLILLNLILKINLSSQSSNFFLDYTLYSQLIDEFKNENFFDLNHNSNSNKSSSNLNKPLSATSIFNYFKLNKETLQKYSNYLFFSENERLRLKKLAIDMFQFGYDNYMKYAFPLDELDPIHCKGRGPDHLNPNNININDALGDYLLTLVDSLSSLVVFGNSTEFKRASKLVIENLNFDKDNTVQVFEATIRVMGGLLSAHLIATDENQPFGDMKITDYDNELLNLAHDLGVRLLTAFNNHKTQLPYPRVNLKNGIPENSFNHTCTSGAGTLVLEFGMLGNLLNDPIFEKVARDAVNSIFLKRNNETGLFGNELNIHTGEWLSAMSGLGAGIDSYVEYLLKSYILFSDINDYKMYDQVKKSLKKYLRHGRAECSSGVGHHPLYLNVDMKNGRVLNNWVDSLQASYPGVLVLDGEIEEAICFHALYFAIWKKFGILPERYNWNLKLPDVYFYPLRPEFAESTYFLYRATRSPFYLHVAKMIIENIYEITKVKCGFATVHDVLDFSLEDRMESFFLSETLKYLYLIFDKENYLNNDGEMKYVFSTEGHLYPIKQAYEMKQKNSLDSNKFKTDNKFIFKNDDYYKMNYQLPMKIKYFDQLFEFVGIDDNLTDLLVRKYIK